MKLPMFSRAVLLREIRETRTDGVKVFPKGTAGAIVDYFDGIPGVESAYVLEVCDATGEGDVVDVPESALGPEPEDPREHRKRQPAGRRAR